MSGFAALMALSASQTKQVQSAVQTALQQRQRNEELRRKKQEEEARKAREEEAKLRQKRFEDEKRQLELEAKREVERGRLVAEQARREEEARQALLYGPKKAKQGPRWPMSQSAIKDELRQKRGGEDDRDSRSGSPAMALTREEKRHRRMEAETRRTYQLKRASGYSKYGRRLPGGAIDVQSAPASDAGASAQSVKARLASLPNTLTKLNVNKRDVRTIDEIVQDIAKTKNTTLDGDDAREFNDWFGKARKKEPASLPSTQSNASLTSGSSSGGNSPRQAGTRGTSQPLAKSQPSVASGKASSNLSSTRSLSSLQSRSALSTKSSMLMIPKHTPAAKSSQSKSPVSKSHASATPAGAPSRSGKVPSKKRPRSPSPSLSPPPPSKRRASEPENTLGSEIWKLFGKDRNSYVARDVLSDDEDMEADMSAVMKEEMRSTRLARREDEIALDEEKRREEEKRRRKRERDIRER